MDYTDRADNLGTREFFKPKTGNYMVTFLSEGKPTTGTFNKGEPNERTVPQLEFRIKIDGQEYTWTVTEAKAFNSLYGQIILLGRYHGSLEGKAIHMTVQGDGKKRVYMIQEATDLMAKAEKERKIKVDVPKETPQEGGVAIDKIFSEKAEAAG